MSDLRTKTAVWLKAGDSDQRELATALIEATDLLRFALRYNYVTDEQARAAYKAFLEGVGAWPYGLQAVFPVER